MVKLHDQYVHKLLVPLLCFFQEASSLLHYRIIFQDTISFPMDETEESKGTPPPKKKTIYIVLNRGRLHTSISHYLQGLIWLSNIFRTVKSFGQKVRKLQQQAFGINFTRFFFFADLYCSLKLSSLIPPLAPIRLQECRISHVPFILPAVLWDGVRHKSSRRKSLIMHSQI